MQKMTFRKIVTNIKIINVRQIEPEKYSGFIAYIFQLYLSCGLYCKRPFNQMYDEPVCI